MREFRLTPAAEFDLEEVWEYTVQQWSVSQAERYVDTLLDACQNLADDPIGVRSTPCDDIRSGYRCCHVERHVIYFMPAEYGVAIIRILHERMDAPRHFL